MDTYTPQSGLTPQGTQINSLVNLLAQAQAMPPQQMTNANVTPQQVAQPTAQAMQMQANEPSFLTSEQQNLTQQAGIPQLQGQQQNLGQVFQMWLADQNLAQKYQGGQLNTPNSPIFNNPNLTPQGIAPSNVIGGSNPYLASPSNLIAAVTQPSGQGFQGFTDPNLITGAMGQVPTASANMMNLLQSAIGSQTGLVNQGLGNAQTQYEGQTNMLSSIANLLSGIYQNKQALASNPTGIIGSTAQAGSVFDDIVTQVQAQKGGNATEKDIWDYINQHAGALKDQGVNVQELWKLQKDMAQKVGQGGLISGGKTSQKSGKYQLKKMPDGSMANYDPKTGKLLDMNGKPLNVTGSQVDTANKLNSTLDDVLSAYTKMNPLEQRISPQLASQIPALAPDMATMNTKYFLGLEPDLRKLVVGGRITVQEMKWIQNAVLPTAYDTPDSYAKRINAAKEMLNQAVSGGSSVANNKVSSKSNDPLGIL